ncbi:hypothetical protein Tco_0143771 [Tanacetum coccineum]
MSPLHFSKKKKKVESQTVTPTLPKSQVPEASESLLQKRKKPLSKKAPKETKATPPPSQRRVLSNPTQSPQAPYLVPKIQRDTYNSMPADKGLPSTTSNEGTAKTTPRLEGLLGDKDSEGNKTPADMEPIHPTVAGPSGSDVRAFLLSDDKAQESEEDILGAAKEADEDSQTATIQHQDHTDKLVEATMSSLDKSNTTISDLYKGLNIITKFLKEINNAVKDDIAINKKISEATETFTKISTNITEVLSLIKGFNFSDLQSTIKDLQAHALKQEEELAAWAKSSTNMA